MNKAVILILWMIPFCVSSQISWNSIEVESGSILQKMHVFSDNEAILIGLNTTVKKTFDGGMSWNDVILPDTILNLIDVDFWDMSFYGDTGFAVHRSVKLEELGKHDLYANSNILYSINKGASWTIIDYSNASNGSNTPTTDMYADSCYNVEITSIALNNMGRLFVCITWDERNGDEKIDHSRIYSSNDKGLSWTDELNQDLGSTFVKTILFKNGKGYIGGNGVFYENEGEGWVDESNTLLLANNNDNYYVNDFLPSGDSVIYITTTSDGVFSYKLDNKRFLKFNETGGFATYHFSDDNYFVVGTSSKTVITNDFGATWEPASPGSTLYNIGGLMGVNLFSLGRSNVYYFDITDIPTSLTTAKYNLDLVLKPVGHNQFVIDCEEGFMAEIYDLKGTKTDTYNSNDKQALIDLNSYKFGIYILKVTSNSGLVRVQKVFIK